MASPQTENGYTKIANELLEAFIQAHFTEYQRKIVLFVWRKTYGWKKKEDYISNSQFVEGTKISKGNVSRTIKELEMAGVVKRNGKKFFINKDYEQWQIVIRRDNKSYPTGKQKVIPTATTKEKKENIQTAVSPKAKTAVSSKTMKNSFYEEKIIDEEGNPLDEVEKKGRNEIALRLRRYYNKEAQRIRENDLEYGGTMGSYTMLCKLLKEHSEEEVKEMLDYYLYSEKFIEYPMLTSALSQDSIRRFFEKV